MWVARLHMKNAQGQGEATLLHMFCRLFSNGVPEFKVKLPHMLWFAGGCLSVAVLPKIPNPAGEPQPTVNENSRITCVW
jgi:hypothetical protein